MTRFLPAAAVTSLVLEIPYWMLVGGSVSSVLRLAGVLGVMCTGYLGALAVMRPWLRDDAGVAGRRAVVAGIGGVGLIVAGAAVFRFGSTSLGTALARLGGLYFASSAVVTLGIFFPWIAPRGRGVEAVTTADQSAATALPAGEIDSTVPNREGERVV
jgi:hypothetical protein